MKFNFDNYNETYVMHCKTEEEKDEFLNLLMSLGKNWNSGGSYSISNWYTYHNRTCYCFVGGTYCDIEYYKNEGYKILEWSDFSEHTYANILKEMSKNNFR